jgi:hypothetical protein
MQQLGLPTKLAGLTALAFKLAMMTLPAVFPLTGQLNLHHSIYGSIMRVLPFNKKTKLKLYSILNQPNG